MGNDRIPADGAAIEPEVEEYETTENELAAKLDLTLGERVVLIRQYQAFSIARWIFLGSFTLLICPLAMLARTEASAKMWSDVFGMILQGVLPILGVILGWWFGRGQGHDDRPGATRSRQL